MTANQIAARQTAEMERHNQATEDEAALHNRTLEDLQAEQNRINAKAESFNEEYQTSALQWKKEYDSAYLEWQKASGTRKLDLEEQLNNIKAAEQRDLANFHQESINIQEQANKLQEKRDSEVARHNAELEIIQDQARKDQAMRWQNQSNIEWYNASTQRTKVKNDWNIAMDTNNLRNYEYNLNKAMFNYEQERNKLLDELTRRRTTSGDVLNYASAFSQVSHGLVNFANLGGDYGKKKASKQITRTAREAAEAYLFGD